jgi:hypothetical protein
VGPNWRRRVAEGHRRRGRTAKEICLLEVKFQLNLGIGEIVWRPPGCPVRDTGE